MADTKFQIAAVLFSLLLLGTLPGFCQRPSATYRVGVGPTDSPAALFTPGAPYTSAAAKAKIKGTVFLHASIGTDGCAHNLTLVRGLGYGLDESAMDAVSKWRFKTFSKLTPINIEVNFDPSVSTENSLKSIPPCVEQK